MSNKIVVISTKNLQNLQNLQCFIQPSSGSNQIQEIASVSTFADGGAGRSGGAAQSVSTAPVSVCYASPELLNSAVPINSATRTAADVISSPQLEAIVGNEDDEGDGEDPSENLSAEDYSFQDNEDELMQMNDGRRRMDLTGGSPSIRAPSMHLRYTGTRIPGRGFDGGIGKCVVYRDGVQRELTLQEVVDILANPDLNKLSTMPPVRPRGGSIYLYRCPDYETRHDLRADQYLWVQQGTKKIPKEDPVVKRFYMYIRTEDPIKNVSKRPKKTFTKYDVRFKKCEYELINAEDPLILVHYTGDEGVWKPFRQSSLIRADRPFERGIKPAGFIGGVTPRPRDDYSTLTVPEGYDPIGIQREKDTRSYATYFNRPHNGDSSAATSATSAKRSRLSNTVGESDLNETAAAANAIAISETANYENIDETSASPMVDRRMDATYAAPPVVSEEPTIYGGASAEIRSRFDTVWPTFEMCHNARMQGFVHALSVIPQVVVTAGSRYLLNLANDLAQLTVTKKTNRFEFYYVSAGPVGCGYYLSTLLFRHSLFDSEPIIPVAFLVHERRSVGDHRRLFELIKEKCPDVASSDCIFITDREYGNISSVLPKAVQLFSWHYIEDDVVNWVESNGGSSEEANSYLSDVQSLMKMKTVDIFRRELALKRRNWPASFSSFFDTCLKGDILSKGGRWQSDGLNGGVYDPFCGVVIPSCNYLNELVGDLVAWPDASLEQLLQCMYHFSEFYVREIERSMHQVGSFKLFPQFGHYARPSRRLRSFRDLEVADPRQIVSYVRML